MSRQTRRINHTRRVRIDRGLVKLSVFAQDGVVSLSVSAALQDLEIENDAKVFLDVSRKAQSERISMGSIGSPIVARKVRTAFNDPVGLRYDVVVVGDEDALLLAAARRVKPENSEAKESLLAIRTSDDLGERLWRLDLTDQPVLEINDQLTRWQELTDNAVFQCLVLPVVVGEILTHLAEQGSVDLDDEDDPLSPWAKYFTDLGVDVEELCADTDIETRRHLIDQAVESFAAEHEFVSQVLKDPEWGGQ